jgi:hypothetical protein
MELDGHARDDTETSQRRPAARRSSREDCCRSPPSPRERLVTHCKSHLERSAGTPLKRVCVYASASVAANSRVGVATARYLAMLVAIDQITRARTPGKNPNPNRLSSPRPSMTARNGIRNATAPISATMPVHRANAPVRSVSARQLRGALRTPSPRPGMARPRHSPLP